MDTFNTFGISDFQGVTIAGNTGHIEASLQKSLFIVQKIESNSVIVLNKDCSSYCTRPYEHFKIKKLLLFNLLNSINLKSTILTWISALGVWGVASSRL